MHWAIWDAMYKAQMAFDGVIANFPNKFIGRMLYRIIFPLGHPYDVPSDKIGHQVAKLLIAPSASRDRLTAETYLPKVETEAVGAIELALKATHRGRADRSQDPRGREGRQVSTTIRDANVRDHRHRAFAEGGVITPRIPKLKASQQLRDIVIRVDDFSMDFGLSQPAAGSS
jgi:acyl-CoA dehydrogenase